MSASHSSIYWTETFGGKPVPLHAQEPDPNSFHSDFYYNTTQNQLYRLEVASSGVNNIKTKIWTIL